MKNLVLILALVVVAGSQAQIRYDTATLVSKSDPIYAVLESHKVKVQKAYEDAKRLPPVFTDWVLVQSPAATQLFPRLVFAGISWSNRAPPNDHSQSVAVGLQQTVGVEKSSNHLQVVLEGNGNYEGFGSLLATNHVQIQDAADAKTVWDAFCDLHFYHWKSHPVVKKSETIWHLGNSTIGQDHYYYEVVLDEQHQVKSARLRSDRVKTPESK